MYAKSQRMHFEDLCNPYWSDFVVDWKFNGISSVHLRCSILVNYGYVNLK